MNRSFEKALTENREWDWSYENVYVKPNIPHKKLMNALSYAPAIDPRNILILIDDTVFGGAKDGMLITNEAIYCHEIMTPMKRIDLAQIREIGMDRNSQVLINKQKFFKAHIVNHLALLTITARVDHALKQCRKKLNDEASCEAQIITENSENHDEQIGMRANKIHSYLNFIAHDQRFSAIKKIANVNKVTSVASFFLRDPNENRPVDKIVQEFPKILHKSVFFFRTIFIDELGILKLANDLSTIEVECYISAKIISRLQKYTIPGYVLDCIVEDAIPDALYIKNERDHELLISIIKSYVNDHEPIALFIGRIFINNVEKRLIGNIKPYIHLLYDFDNDDTTEHFFEFASSTEQAIERFENKVDVLVKEYTGNVLNIVHHR